MPHAVICVMPSALTATTMGSTRLRCWASFCTFDATHVALALSPSSSRGRITQKVIRARAISMATDRNDSPQPSCDIPPDEVEHPADQQRARQTHPRSRAWNARREWHPAAMARPCRPFPP